MRLRLQKFRRLSRGKGWLPCLLQIHLKTQFFELRGGKHVRVGPLLVQTVQEPDLEPECDEGGYLRPQYRIKRHVIKEHLFLLLNPGKNVCKLPHNGRVHSEHSCADHPVPRQLALGLKEVLGQGNSIRICHDIGVVKWCCRSSPNNRGILLGGRRHFFPMGRGMLTEEKRLEPPGEVLRVAHSHAKCHDFFE